MSAHGSFRERPVDTSSTGRSAAPDGDGASDGAPGPLTERSARIVAAHKLFRRPRRLQTGEFLADGAQAVREAVAVEREKPGTVLELFVTEAGAARNTQIVRDAFAAGLEVTQVTDAAAAKLSDAVTPQGITARCSLPTGAGSAADEQATALRSVLDAQPRLVAVLVGTSDPGNAGTVIRLADAAGADAVIVAGEAVDPWGSKAVRSSTGSIFHLPVVRYADVGLLVSALQSEGMLTFATTGSAELDLDSAVRDGMLTERTAWLFGSEAHGLPSHVIDMADESVRVPIHGRAESLNLATAAAVCLYASASAHHGVGSPPAPRAKGTAG